VGFPSNLFHVSRPLNPRVPCTGLPLRSDTLHYAAEGNPLLSSFGHLVHGSRTMLTYGARGSQAEALTSQADTKDLGPRSVLDFSA
jgi:hypothetical protein